MTKEMLPHHSHGPGDLEQRVKSLENLLIEKALVDSAAMDELVDTYENCVGPRNGARVVAKAWRHDIFVVEAVRCLLIMALMCSRIIVQPMEKKYLHLCIVSSLMPANSGERSVRNLILLFLLMSLNLI